MVGKGATQQVTCARTRHARADERASTTLDLRARAMAGRDEAERGESDTEVRVGSHGCGCLWLERRLAVELDLAMRGESRCFDGQRLHWLISSFLERPAMHNSSPSTRLPHETRRSQHWPDIVKDNADAAELHNP